ncbi:gas vesicle protein [Halalkalibacillus sediminis]|uniref:Gas vesicle protein n=1 Tax=Halalkalibacillus sediminis TaxID=2018042 RepID=A0A2I0QXS7_9BACI|nr:gas vesicle protein [Halalkalibacillus sediminis]PKR79141.1 gas vesicle protein [Halalkalibacillus sediminis]
MVQTETLQNRDVSLVEILDAVLDKGVVLKGDITISIADVDLVHLDLRILLSSVETLMEAKKTPSVEEYEQKYVRRQGGL